MKKKLNGSAKIVLTASNKSGISITEFELDELEIVRKMPDPVFYITAKSILYRSELKRNKKVD
jgi:hypothetical protein